jgi:hypothetical protein
LENETCSIHPSDQSAIQGCFRPTSIFSHLTLHLFCLRTLHSSTASFSINTSTLIRLRRARASCQVGAEGDLPLACWSIPVSLPPRIRSTKEFRKHYGGSSVQNHSNAPSVPRRHLFIHNILFYASKHTVIFLPRS